jgi:CheY-like chemotaxis protein
MGLGLAIVSGLSQALDHPIALRSEPGVGSSFALRVPLGVAVAGEAASAVEFADELKNRVILVIDDEASIRDAVCEVLRRWECKPVAAASAREAAGIFRERGDRPDAMVVDYQLDHGVTGLDAIAELHAALGVSIPAVIVTGDTQPERLREATQGGHLLLHKPLAPMRLRAALTSALRAPSSAAQQPSVARI